MTCSYSLGTQPGDTMAIPIVIGYATTATDPPVRHPSSLLSATNAQVATKKPHIEIPDAYSEKDVYNKTDSSTKVGFLYYAITDNNASFSNDGIECREWIANDMDANSASGTPEINPNNSRLCPIDETGATGLSGSDQYVQFFTATSAELYNCYKFVVNNNPSNDSGVVFSRTCCYTNGTG